MNLRSLILTMLLLGLMVVRMPAHAEGNCPPGFYPIGGQGVQGCAPIPGQQQQQQQQQQQTQSIRAPQWQSRWGAIVTDADKGIVGSASDMLGQEQAERTAMDDCVSKGGTDCKLAVSYANACGAMVLGDHRFNVDRGETLEAAIRASMKTCSAEDTHCHVYFTTCSPAQRIQ